MKKHNNIFYILILCIVFTSCDRIDSFLDKAEAGGYSIEEIFGQYITAEGFLSNIYASLPSEYGRKYTAATDESKSLLGTGAAENHLLLGNFSPSANPYNNWNATFEAIRKANIFLQNIDGVPVVDVEQARGRPRMKGEAMFLRAFFYSELFRRWGGIPIITEPLDLSDNIRLPRNSVEQVVDFIVSQCDQAALLLPVDYPANHLGRVTKGAALSLKARTLLHAASLLHNPDYDRQKWKAAADAAKEVIDLNIYRLDNQYKMMFHKRVSPEIIFQHNVNNTQFTGDMIPISLGVGSTVYYVPTQTLVDDYEMTNGEKPILSYNADGSPNINPASGYNPNNPYVNRDPRFALSILYNGSVWRSRTIWTHVGAPIDGIDAQLNPAATGYYFCKMLDPAASITPTVINGSNYWIFIRYAEILLSYAEALNEYLDVPDTEVYDAINEVRSRTGVGMPNLPLGLNKDEMRERIRKERRIELAFEGHRFWDIKRWRIGTEVMKEAYGMRITKRPDNSFAYQRILIDNNRTYLPAFDLFPIPQPERNKNPNLSQNPGYN